MKARTLKRLFLSTVSVLVLLLPSPTQADVKLPQIVSVVPQPFWTTLNFFRSEPKVSLILLAPSFLSESQPNYAAANRAADFSTLAGLSDNAKTEFPFPLMIEEKSSRQAASVNLDPGSTHKSSVSSDPSLADNWSRVAGVGSTIPAFSTGFGLVSDNTSATTLESPKSEAIAAVIDHAPRYAGEPESAPITSKAQTSAIQPSQSANTSAAFSAPAFSAPTSPLKAGSSLTIAAQTIGPGAPDAITSLFTWAAPGTGNAKWTTASNWGGVAPPTSGADLAFGGTNKLTPLMDGTYSILSLTFNAGAGAFNLTSNSGTEILTLGAGGITNNSSNLQTITSPLVLGAAQSWNASSAALTINSSTVNTGGFGLTISGANNTIIANVISNTGSLTKNGAGTLTLSGASTYSGGTFFGNSGGSAAGTLALGSSSVGAPGAVTSGPIGTGTLTLRGTGASSTIRSTDATARTLNNAIVFSGTSVDIHFGSNTTGDLTFGGAMDLGAGVRIVEVDNTNTTFSGIISGSAGNGLTKAGTGTLILSGGSGNTYNGLTTVNAGELDLNKTAGNAIAGNLTIGDGTLTDTVKLLASNQIADASVVTLTIAGSAAFNLNGFNETIGSLTDSAAGSSGASVQLGSGTLIFGDASNRTFGGVISGSGGKLTKQGAGTQTLSGGSANTYTGLTTILLGELDLSKTAGVNAIAGDGNTGTNDVSISGGTLKWLASNQVADSASITMSSGALTLNGFTETIFNFSNSGGTFTTGSGTFHGTGASITWSGGTNTVNSGGLVDDGHIIITGGTNTVQANGVLSLLSGGAGLEMTGSTLTLDSSAGTAGKLLLTGDLTTSASATTSNISSGGALANPGNIDLNAGSRTFTVADGAAATDLSVSASIINGSLVKAGNGLANLSGVNSYSGTTVSAGTLRLSGAGTLGSTTGSLTVNGGTVDVNGTSQTVGALSGSGGTILNNGGATNLTFGNGGGSGAYDGLIANGTGSLGLIKTGAGTEALNGANSYGGTTQVNAGTLFINGNQSTATGAVSVNNTGTLLGGIGTIGGAVTVNQNANITGATNGTVGSLSMASLTFTGVSLNLATFIVDLVGAASDTLNITGVLDLSNLFDALSFNGTPDGTSTYTLATYTSHTGVFNTAAAFAGYQYIYGATSLELSPLTPVPEPSTWLAGALALLAVGYTQRRRFGRKPAFARVA